MTDNAGSLPPPKFDVLQSGPRPHSIPGMYKCCIRCKKRKTSENYSRDARSWDQLKAYCRECAAAARQAAAVRLKGYKAGVAQGRAQAIAELNCNSTTTPEPGIP